MFDSRQARLRVIFLAMASIAILAFAACGSDDGGSSDDATSTTGAGGPTSTASSSGATPTVDLGDFDDYFANVCSYINLMANIPSSQIDASASDEPSNATTRDIANYFASVLSDALSDATPVCYLEFMDGGEFGMYVSYDLDEDAPTNAADLIKDELIDRGVSEDDIEAISLAGFGFGFSSVTATNIGVLGQYSDDEVVLFVNEDSVVFALDADSDSSPSATSTPVVVGTPQPTATPTAMPTASASGVAADIDAELQQALEDALGVELDLSASAAFNAGGVSTVTLTYDLVSETTVNVESKLSALVETFNGTIAFSGSASGTVSMTYSGLMLGGVSIDGTLVYDGETVGLFGTAS